MELDQKLTFYQIICYLKSNWISPLSFITARPQCTYCLEKSLNFLPHFNFVAKHLISGQQVDILSFQIIKIIYAND